MDSNLMTLIPTQCLDVHVLRTSKQSIVAVLLRLEGQYGLCRETESIQEVIRALSLTMRDVEEAWGVWRHECVRTTLRSGFAYIRVRIGSARWRRGQGRPPAAFVGYQSLYPPFRYAGAPSSDQSWGRQAGAGSVTQAVEVSGTIGEYNSLAQTSNPQYPQFTYAPIHAVSQHHHAPPQSASVGAWDYPPPPYPPPTGYQSQQQPIPNVNAGPSSLSPDVVAAVEVATRFLEAVNKAVNICIELNAV
ncbi:hypothetical protein H4582DRAFT_1579552 [Lactarius indigo]|nr:hypothetical protein H4582DRAFT_1579552 [Lactarius indigo]